MKKMTVAVATFVMMAAMIAGAGQINWGNSLAVVDPSGNAIGAPMSPSDWLIELTMVVGTADENPVGGDDVVINQGTWSLFVPGTWAGILQPTAGDFDVYVRVYDNAVAGSAANFVNLYGGANSIADPYTINALGPTDVSTFDPGGAAAGDWQPIPEPGTLALFGLGLLTIAVRRRIRK